jgi:L-alanine-DL-glutamate epimerase-like enolase superfamily enzyme
MRYQIEARSFALGQPFVITGHTWTHADTVWVTLEQDGAIGRGEGLSVYYLGETQTSMVTQLESVRTQVESGISRAELQQLLPAGGARNALDCALWDLECKLSGERIWQLAGIEPKQLVTVATVGIGTPAAMAARAQEFARYPNLKIKLDAHDPIERLAAIRESRPDATLVVDANQGWSFEQLKGWLPELVDFEIAMIEQPLPRGNDAELEGFESPIPLGGDESCLTLSEYEQAARRYDVINIKLDKTGGLTEALLLAERARLEGKRLMVGNMTGTSLSMAPAYIIGQFCDFVDIDGPLLLAQDIADGLSYLDGGIVEPPAAALWG